MKILIIEDEKKVVSFLKKGLVSEGYAVDVASDGEEGLFMAKEGDYEVIILDVMLPQKDGLSVCRELRAAGKNSPIIMLTAKDAVEDRVKGLEAGADDYLVKPFSFAELLARIRALVRRHKGTSGNILKIADLTLDPETHEVKRGGKLISLSATEFRFLKYLMENTKRVVSRSLILENVWGYDFDPESNIVEVYIKYLRDKIDRGFKKSLIKTVPGVGYRLCA
jgi:heavy metal response regulator